MAHIGALGDARMFRTLSGNTVNGRTGTSRRKPSTTSASTISASSGPTSIGSSTINTVTSSTSRSTTSTSTRSRSRPGSGTNIHRSCDQLSMPTPNLIDLKTISAEEIEWEGYVYKQRKLVKSWTPRYLTLQNRTITVYKTKAHAIAKEPVRGKWIIHQILTKLPSSSGFGSSKLHPDLLGFGFLASNGNLIHLVATSWIEKRVWIYMMRQGLNRSSAETSAAMLAPTTQPGVSGSSPPKLTTSSSTSKLTSSLSTSKLLNLDLSSNNPLTTIQKSRSADNVHKYCEFSIIKHLADQFLSDILLLLCAQDMDILSEQLPLFLRQLSKDVEIWFDLETMEMSQSCVFKGIYHGREGFVHFIALFITKYAFIKDIQGETFYRAEDEDHHGYACFHQLVNLVSNSTTSGKFALQLSFTPAKRVSRVVLSFRCRTSSNSSSSSTTTKPSRRKSPPPSFNSSSSTSTTSSSCNPVAISQHPTCFHQAYLSKRSLALSFADFDVVGVLGQGGFGTVVLVQRHHNPEEYFAIKIIDKHSGAESALKERRILSGVCHPFLACLRFAFQTSTKLYLGLDYYKGGNLYLHMHSCRMDPSVSVSSGRRFNIDRVRFYAAELAIALSYLHTNGIIYRDLKPDNIMLDRFGHIRLVDFGISKQLQQDPSCSVSLSEDSHAYCPTGTIAGSPAYIAPEQLLTQKPQYGMQADWWSYGVLLYEMVTGSTPFHDSNISQMYRKIQTEQVNYNRKPVMDPDIMDLLQHLLVRDPSQRYGMHEVKQHAFFKSIDWDLLEKKEIDPPFIPPAEELMQNVHTHFRNMKVEETIGHMENTKPNTKKGGFGRKMNNIPDPCSHFDEFSFAYDTTRETFDGLSMADDGWLMRQLAEGAALRERLQEPEMEEQHVGGIHSEDEENGMLKTTGSSESLSSGSPTRLKQQNSSELEEEEEVNEMEGNEIHQV